MAARTEHAPEHDPRPMSDDPYWLHAMIVAVLATCAMPALVVMTVAFTPRPAPNEWIIASERIGAPPAEIAEGAAAFRSACAVCHGADGQGVPRLGKPLRNSAFVQSQSDGELLSLILQGRTPTDPANTTGVPMPPRAGNPGLSEATLAKVVLYMRSIQEPGAALASLDSWQGPPSLASSGDGSGSGGGMGHDVFLAACSACHGPNGEGMEGLGKPLATSPFVGAKTDDELIAFVKQGRPIWDPENTTGLDMPPKGGNPALSDEDLKNIVAYIRNLHPETGAR